MIVARGYVVHNGEVDIVQVAVTSSRRGWRL
jgi:hypothetical protein